MKKSILFPLLLLAIVIRASDLPDGFVELLVARNLDPTDMAIAPDGRIFIVIKSGKILIVEKGTLLVDPFLDIVHQVDNYNERGLGHMVFDPDFETNQFYYVYYTVKGENRNRVSRFTATGNFTVPESEEVILNLNELPGTIHNSGAMVFGMDGKLYISTGEGAIESNSQSKDNLLGKILRINKDGTIPDDNPFFSDTTVTGVNKAIWALGLRNPYSMSNDPITGKIYSNDVGGNEYEEVNEILRGRNYGWPTIEGMRTVQRAPPNYKNPIYAYPHGFGLDAGCAIVGSAIYSFEQNPPIVFPAQFHGRYFFADYCGGYIKTIAPIGADPKPEIFATGINRPVAVLVSPDGSLYYLARGGIGGGSEEDNTSTTDGTLWRVMYTGSGEPVISVQPQDILIPRGENARFSVSVSGSHPFTYQWEKDGTNIPGATSSNYTVNNVHLMDDGSRFRCIVTNSRGTDTSQWAILSVTANTRPNDPEIIVSLPDGATLYQAGYKVIASGTATDAEDGDLEADAFLWKIDFHHDDHTHPGLGWTTGLKTIEYDIPIVGETSENVWLRIYLRATDSEGLSQTSYKEVYPQKTKVTLLTDPPGLNIKLDGREISTPYMFTSVVGQLRAVEGLPYQRNSDNLYIFDSWKNETEISIKFQVPDTGRTFTASYFGLPLGDGDGLEGHYFSNQIKTFEGGPTLTRIDSVIDFNWGYGPPDPIVSSDRFTVRWLGEILPPVSDEYTFHAVSDDGIRLWIDSLMIIDQWIDQGPTEWSGHVFLQGQHKYPIKMEYYENLGGSVIQLYWSSSVIPRQIVLSTQLFNDLTTSAATPTKTEFSIYPTIADQYINISTDNPQPLRWTIFDMMGQKMISGELKGHNTQIEVSTLPTGLYIFHGIKYNARFIKE